MIHEIPFPLKDQATYLIFPKFISNETCKEIISIKDKIDPEKGQTGRNDEVRISNIRWIHWQNGIDTLYEALRGAVSKANAEWNFNLIGFIEPLQLTHYVASEKGHYGWHADRYDLGIGRHRKLSMTLLLNDNFRGGEFEFFDTKEQPKMKRGDLLIFPSYLMHRVKEITEAERWSLVAWISGPPYQ